MKSVVVTDLWISSGAFYATHGLSAKSWQSWIHYEEVHLEELLTSFTLLYFQVYDSSALFVLIFVRSRTLCGYNHPQLNYSGTLSNETQLSALENPKRKEISLHSPGKSCNSPTK